MIIDTEKNQTKQKSKKRKGVVSFEEEIINREKASELLSNLSKPEPVTEPIENRAAKLSKKQKRKHKEKIDKQNINVVSELTNNEQDLKEEFINENKSKKKKVKLEQVTSSNEIFNKNGKNVDREVTKSNVELNENSEVCVQKVKNKKKKKDQETESDENTTELVDTEAVNEVSKNITNSELSKRAKKKKKHLEQLAAKKLKTSLATQENVLNYLSKWKHSRTEWKFEKLKQIWLSQNLFDSAKIPEEFWETAVEYFSQSRGFIKKLILREAMKIIEEQDKAEEENTDEDYIIKVNRARGIVQTLQE
ncbi:uncharacterized protein C7orf50 homolog [Diorhabda sublineata]|uniref:uncharacterized protein C7orf50 homolog n=1 Tax=Diorhabda sublineata TaxID=1163346 RepID=UPI0024E13B59|nr:uncharacterized protein C7orf50 homolog [Diorhabda sublineata]